MSDIDNEALQQVYDAVCTLRRDGPWSLNMGICDNVEGLLSDEDGEVMPGFAAWLAYSKQAFVQWDKFSGSIVFPVQDPTAPGTPTMQYTDHHGTDTLWEGEQGELRKDLLDHLIKYFTVLLEEAFV